MKINFCLLFIFMLFCHIVDDYYLQGILASMKQKAWWLKQPAYKNKYRNDYKVALFMHSASWSFMIMLPLLLFCNLIEHQILYCILFVFNVFLHYITDNEKANEGTFNLVTDQFIHIMQILFTITVVYLIV